MQSFEFLFNPDSPYAVYDTFCFEPEDKKEKKLGNLYMAGELENSLPQKRHLLSSLADIIRKEYYKNFDDSPEESLKKSLEKANEFLSFQVKNNNVDWLGNLDFVVLTIDSSCSLNLAKVGNLRIFILRSDEILDMGQAAGLQEMVSPSKIFQNIITGNLDQGNKILITIKEIADLLEKEKVLEDLTKVEEKGIKRIFKINRKLFEKEHILESLVKARNKEIKKIFKTKRELLKNLFGFCLLISLTSKKRRLSRISFSKIRFPFLSTRAIARGGDERSSSTRLIPELSKERLKKSLISILILAILLLLGFFLFK